MTWIQTYTGKKFHFDGADPSEVCIEDIAVGLSRMPRFAGHTTEFYSVAEHSVAVAKQVAEWGGNYQEQLLGLLHDATEAYMCDVPKPLKRMLPEFSEIEGLVWCKIARHFFSGAFDLPTFVLPDIVKEADGAMLAAEARDLFKFAPLENWVRRCPSPPETKIVPCNSFLDAEAQFYSQFRKIRCLEPALT